MTAKLRSMEVLRRRQKYDKACYNKDDYDGKIRNIIIEKSGCRPVAWVTNRSEPICTTRKSLLNVVSETNDYYYQFTRNKKYLEPCHNIEKIEVDYADVNIPNVESSDHEGKGWFVLEFIIIAKKFKEIKQVRKYSVQSLVGNSGGYIGLCLGYALWNIPTTISKIWKHMTEKYFHWHN